MSEHATKSSPKLDTGPGTSAALVSTQSAEAPTLITEQQVLLSSAAAVAIPPARTRRFSDMVHAIAGAVGAWLASAAKPPTRPVYPKRHVWLENALMSREMDRL
jgi:hypothetical protein